MSLKMPKKVPELVEKYRNRYPAADRAFLRKLIRLENPDVFPKKQTLEYQTNLKKLDRHLRKAFANQPSSKQLSYDPVEKALLKLSEEQNKTTMEEVASQVGIPPSNIEKSVYQLVQKHGWKTSKTRLGELEIDFNKPFDPRALKFGPVRNPWRPSAE